jgi:mono/diheme cytochrome c family protein
MATLTDDERAAIRAYVDRLLADEPDLTDDELEALRPIIRPTLTPPAKPGAGPRPGTHP